MVKEKIDKYVKGIIADTMDSHLETCHRTRRQEKDGRVWGPGYLAWYHYDMDPRKHKLVVVRYIETNSFHAGWLALEIQDEKNCSVVERHISVPKPEQLAVEIGDRYVLAIEQLGPKIGGGNILLVWERRGEGFNEYGTESMFSPSVGRHICKMCGIPIMPYTQFTETTQYAGKIPVLYPRYVGK